MAKHPGGWQGKRGTRHERGYGAAWDKTRDRIRERDGNFCQPCMRDGKIKPAREVDHITPKAEGGTDDDANLQSICIPCHRAKTQAEGARAQGRRVKRQIGADGWPT